MTFRALSPQNHCRAERRGRYAPAPAAAYTSSTEAPELKSTTDAASTVMATCPHRRTVPSIHSISIHRAEVTTAMPIATGQPHGVGAKAGWKNRKPR